MEEVTLDHLANPTNLRAFIDAMSGMTGTSPNMVLDTMVEVLERRLRQRSDDMYEVYRLGRLLQAVSAESDCVSHWAVSDSG